MKDPVRREEAEAARDRHPCAEWDSPPARGYCPRPAVDWANPRASVPARWDWDPGRAGGRGQSSCRSSRSSSSCACTDQSRDRKSRPPAVRRPRSRTAPTTTDKCRFRVDGHCKKSNENKSTKKFGRGWEIGQLIGQLTGGRLTRTRSPDTSRPPAGTSPCTSSASWCLRCGRSSQMAASPPARSARSSLSMQRFWGITKGSPDSWAMNASQSPSLLHLPGGTKPLRHRTCTFKATSGRGGAPLRPLYGRLVLLTLQLSLLSNC